MARNTSKFLIRHVGNMGDHVFFIPPVLESLKKHYPGCHITLLTAWGYKQTQRRFVVGPKVERWGERNQGGFCINLMMTDPNVDQLVHWHDTKLSLGGDICIEEDKHFPTWSAAHYASVKESGEYDEVFELDFGIGHDDDPMQRMYEAVGLPGETYSNYRLYLTDNDRAVAAAVMRDIPHPRIVLLEGLAGTTTRGWDNAKIPALEQHITRVYGAAPRWFGGAYIPEHEGRPLTLRENIATLELCDMAIGVLSGPLHFAAAVGLPTITLYADMALHRTAPAYFLNEYIDDPIKRHRTIIGPHPTPQTMLKSPEPPAALTQAETRAQHYANWTNPGDQAKKGGLAVLTVDEIMAVVADMMVAAA